RDDCLAENAQTRHSFLPLHPLPLRSPLFPYTTLFRSHYTDHLAYSRLSGVLPVLQTDVLAQGIATRPQLPGRVAMPWASTSVWRDRKSTRLNSSHRTISYAVFCLKKKTASLRHLHSCG